MPARLRFLDFRLSDAPALCGLAQQDAARVAAIANRAQLRLLNCPEAGDEGWWGTWVEMAFTLSATSPYLTTPREVARLEAITVCNTRIPLQNQFYEYLSWNNGRLPKTFPQVGLGRACLRQAYMRNNVPTFVDLATPPQKIAVYPTNPADIGLQVLVQGLDQNGQPVYSLDNNNAQVLGEYVTLTFPFAIAPTMLSQITGIQKAPTLGSVSFNQLDPNSGAQVALLTMEPGEQTSGYRRYYFDQLPFSCCPQPGQVATPVSVTAIAALEHIPVAADSDYFIIQNLEALIAEAQSVYYAAKEDPQSKAIAAERHKAAVSQLVGELSRYQGKNSLAVNFKPMGSASLERVRIGMI
jgi:hypothetical protein